MALLEEQPEYVQKVIEKFWEVVPQVWYAVRAQIHTRAAEHFDITVSQFQLLRRIRKGSNTVSKLAETGYISRPAVSRSIEGLVKRGLVSRQQDPEDRRNVYLSLTGEGESLMNGLFQETHEWMQGKFAMLDEERSAFIIDALEMLYNAMNNEPSKLEVK